MGTHTDKAFKKFTRIMEKRNGPHRAVFVEKFTRTELDNNLKEMQVEEGSRAR